jgi:hypothetical protein
MRRATFVKPKLTSDSLGNVVDAIPSWNDSFVAMFVSCPGHASYDTDRVIC